MKQKIVKLKLLLILPSLGILVGCNEYTKNIKEIEPYLFKTRTYRRLDYDFADKYFAEVNDNWSGGGCSAITKTIDGDRRIVGRNMDLNISNNCVYVVKTNAGKYKTIGLQYTFRDVSPRYKDVKIKGIPKNWKKLIPFYCEDIMNEKGLYIEINMRHGEEAPNGSDLFSCEGTNPSSNKRVNMFQLTRYISENCATIEDAKNYVQTLNIYSKNHNWNYCFILADKTGASSLLEFSSNQIYWIDEAEVKDNQLKYLDNNELFGPVNYHALAQTNFYINEDAFKKQNTKSGFGRMKTLQAGIDQVNTKQEMFNLMDKVSYSNFYKSYNDCKENHFDPRDELIGEAEGLTAEKVMSPEKEAVFAAYLDSAAEEFQSLTRDEKRAANTYWESTFTEVVDIKDKSIFVRFYENDDSKYLLTFRGLKKVDHI